jgi:guanylate kinase
MSGLLLIVSSPSGAGKTTLCHRLLDEHRPLTFSVSYTTRHSRPNEQEGVDYHFVQDARFMEMVERDAFAEWAVVHGHRYGTSYDTVRTAIQGGQDVLFDIDFQGGRQLRAKFPEESVLVFILPPSLTELERRLRGRATDSVAAIDLRLSKAIDELGHYLEYDYLIVNDEIESSYDRLRSIYRAAHYHRHRVAHHAEALLAEARTRFAPSDLITR